MSTDWVETTLSGLSLEERVGQLLMVAFFGLSEQSLSAALKDIETYHLGGHFQCTNSARSLTVCNAAIQRTAKVPLLIGADLEAGAGAVITGGLRFPRPMSRAAAGGDPALEYEIGRITAQQGRAMGVNVTASPVLDANTDPLCPDVNVRAYSDEPGLIARMAIPYIRGLQEHGMLAMGKHFPGNGATSMDQHISAALILESRETLERVFLEPYRQAFRDADLASVMVAHLEVPALVTELNARTGRLVPASVSREVVTQLLKKELGFRGLAMTDAMNMGGINNNYPRAEAAVRAIAAGIDMLLIFNPRDFRIEFDALVRAVRDGTLSEERLEDAVRRVLAAKARIGLHEDKGLPVPVERLEQLLDPGPHRPLIDSLAEKAVTVYRNEGGILPLQAVSGKRVLVVNSMNPDNALNRRRGQLPMLEVVSDELRRRGAQVETIEVDPEVDAANLARVWQLRAECDYVFLNLFHIPSWAIGAMTPNVALMGLLFQGFLTCERPLVVTAFGDPYVMRHVPSAPAFLCTYDESEASQRAAVAAWFGEKPASGRSPIALPGMFERGGGLALG